MLPAYNRPRYVSALLVTESEVHTQERIAIVAGTPERCRCLQPKTTTTQSRRCHMHLPRISYMLPCKLLAAAERLQ
jgi:hypothetical protein